MNENEQVFINMSGKDASQIAYTLQQATNAYNRLQYSQWLHILSSIHERIFHKISEDDETLDSLFEEAEKLQKYWNQVQKQISYGWDVSKELCERNREFIKATRAYSRGVMLELSKQGFFPNRKSMSETRHE